MISTLPPPSLTQRWWLAIRPKTLPVSLSPVLVGCGISLYSLGKLDLPAALAAACISLMLQIAANLINDVADFSKGTDTAERQGPLRVTQAGLLSPRQVWCGVGVCFFLCGILGIFLALSSGWVVIAIGLASILAALAYSTGPFPLSDIGLGDLFSLVFFGFVGVCGTALVTGGAIPAAAWWCGLGVGALVAAVLVVNNVRDADTDRIAGRKNIPTRFGQGAGIAEYVLLLLTACAVPFVLFLQGDAGGWVFLALGFIPFAVRNARDLQRIRRGPQLNLVLAHTARMTLIYSALLALGFVLGTVFRG